MGTPRQPFGFETHHTFDINIRSERFHEVWDLLKILHERLVNLEEEMRQAKTLLREFREGLDALKADEASDDARDQANTLTIEEKEARIKELEAIRDELQARPSLSEAQQAEWEAMVVELGELTGNVITDDDEEDIDDQPQDQVVP